MRDRAEDKMRLKKRWYKVGNGIWDVSERKVNERDEKLALVN